MKLLHFEKNLKNSFWFKLKLSKDSQLREIKANRRFFVRRFSKLAVIRFISETRYKINSFLEALFEVNRLVSYLDMMLQFALFGLKCNMISTPHWLSFSTNRVRQKRSIYLLYQGSYPHAEFNRIYNRLLYVNTKFNPTCFWLPRKWKDFLLLELS